MADAMATVVALVVLTPARHPRQYGSPRPTTGGYAGVSSPGRAADHRGRRSAGPHAGTARRTVRTRSPPGGWSRGRCGTRRPARRGWIRHRRPRRSSSSSSSTASMMPSLSIRSSATNSGAPVRTATATASEGRDETGISLLAVAEDDLGEVGGGLQLGDHHPDHVGARAASSRSRMRSWVMGRGVSIPWRAKAMAVASGAPMKMGSVRPSPSDSWRSSTGVFDCRSTRTARSRTSTMARKLTRQRPICAIGPQVEAASDAGAHPPDHRGDAVSRRAGPRGRCAAGRPGAPGPVGSARRPSRGPGPGPRDSAA